MAGIIRYVQGPIADSEISDQHATEDLLTHRLRAKSGTDKAESSGDIMQDKDQLRHTTVVMTEQYIRNRKGKKVTPTK
ncbi:MAG TPA: hypothetical protein VM577_05930 [Anaerovoracaceae bacterium]|nr:hypothetical protein [Anaerovoracaceae bacterium]